MSSTIIQFRVDKELKEQAQEIYSQLGLDLPTALRIFLKRSIEEKGIPFNMTLEKSLKRVSMEEGRDAFYSIRNHVEAKNLPEMTIEEINAEIAAVRSSR